MSTTEDTRPFVAPCRRLDTTAPLRWLKLGFQDFRQAPLQIGYASWRGYRETIISDEWEQDPDTVSRVT
ncbi:hypothetical protein [Thiothrix subterranea]|uniref:Uncharacterized protein n=1 Tax=Thiothrix subterranea TaxID=2735563 RepID=A0AA51R3P1_9GAMM|nr:hypothetical protein [Thiothrix subterranea]MDQ5770557.1 hypothetical protein [Thiothrix subterranea]WML85745.1 hypothetical protein RCG00_15740 [Thiothrix subterranea]